MTLQKAEKECMNDPHHDATGAENNFWSLSHSVPVHGTWGGSCLLAVFFVFPTHPAACRLNLLVSIYAPLSLQGVVRDLCSGIRPNPRILLCVLSTLYAIEQRLVTRVSSAPYNSPPLLNQSLRLVTPPAPCYTGPVGLFTIQRCCRGSLSLCVCTYIIPALALNWTCFVADLRKRGTSIAVSVPSCRIGHGLLKNYAPQVQRETGNMRASTITTQSWTPMKVDPSLDLSL